MWHIQCAGCTSSGLAWQGWKRLAVVQKCNCLLPTVSDQPVVSSGATQIVLQGCFRGELRQQQRASKHATSAQASPSNAAAAPSTATAVMLESMRPSIGPESKRPSGFGCPGFSTGPRSTGLEWIVSCHIAAKTPLSTSNPQATTAHNLSVLIQLSY